MQKLAGIALWFLIASFIVLLLALTCVPAWSGDVDGGTAPAGGASWER